MSTPVSPSATRRISLWDNGRFIAIFLVVTGHAIQPLAGHSDVAMWLYLAIYTVHVPVFVLISGYFAKATPPGVSGLTSLLTSLVFPYLIFEALWSAIQWFVAGRHTVDFAKPSWTLWFLIALVIWKVSLPYVARLRWPLLTSIVISVSAGYVESITSTFGLTRTLGLLPFFVLGWKIKEWGLAGKWIDSPRAVVPVRVAAAAVITLVLVLLAVFLDTWRAVGLKGFLFYDFSYATLGYPEWWAGAIRLGVMAVSMVLCFAFLALLPRRALWFTALGGATLYVYLLHTFVLYPFRQSGILAGDAAWWWLPVMIVLAAATTLVLASPVVRRIFRPLVEPRASWLLAGDEDGIRRR